MKNPKLFRKYFFGIMLLTGTTQTLAQLPQVSDPGLQIQLLGDLNPFAVRIARNPMDNKLYYCTFFGELYRLDVSGGVYTGALVASDFNHHINYLQGMLFKDSILYLVGNRKEQSTSGYGLLVRGKWQAGGGWSWDTLMHTAVYPSTATLFDHAFSSLCLSQDGNYLFVGSGSRTDHGEIQTSNGLYPGRRDAPLTSVIFKIPLNLPTTIFLPNDSSLLMASGYVYARGVRNTFDMALAPNHDLIGSENSGDRDDPEEINWLRNGYHYGFPWKMGGNLTGQQFPGYVPASDKLINHNCLSWTNNPPYFYNDPSYPPMPGGLNYGEPVRNYGPDADKSRDAGNGHIHDASSESTYITSLTPHRSPLGMAFDTAGLLAAPYGYSGFVLSYTKGSADTTGNVNGGIGPFSDTGQDLLQLCFNKDTSSGIYSMNAYRIAWNFDRPVDSWLEGNHLYIIETHEPDDTFPGRLYRIIFPADTIINGMGFLPADTTICQGAHVTITPKLKGAFSYLWSNGATTQQITVMPSGTKKFWLRIYNGVITLTDTVKIKVNPLPAAVITPAGPVVFCLGSSVQLSAGNENFRYYQWRKNGSDIAGAGFSSYTALYEGTYKVKVTDTQSGCYRVSPAGITVTVNPNPAAAITPQGPVSFCAGDSAVLTANGGAPLTWQWKKNGVLLAGATSISYPAKIAGNYKVVVTNSNGCSKLSNAVTVTVPCRKKENESDVKNLADNLVVYPNPSAGDFIFEWNGGQMEKTQLHVFDMTGREVQAGSALISGNRIKIILPSAGTYRAEVIYNGERCQKMLVKTP
jgi:hypothetical protein